MGVEAFKVFYDRQVHGAQVAPKSEFSKAAAEALHGKFKEKVVIVGPVETCKVIEIEAEEEKQAAIAARYILGAKEGEGEVIVAKIANCKKNPAH